MAERRLAAILVADVVGSSRLIEADEAYALGAIRGALHDVLAASAKRQGGRLIKTTGDGALLEFASPVSAVACATEVQEALLATALVEPPERRVLLRVGINLGDVVATPDGDLYGDGVNIAARLEAIAEPGGIVVSGKVHDELHGRLELPWTDGGEVLLKNIARPVRIWTLGNSIPRASTTPKEPRLTLALPDKPSLAVLPFTNMSGDPEQEYFADGLVEDIITALSRVRSFFVIARTSSFTYKGRSVDVRQVGRELGVRYVLEGSIRKVGQRVRITGQLIEAETGRHVWADRFDGNVADLFEVQDEVTASLVAALEPSLNAAETARAHAKPTESLVAYDFYLRALPHHYAGTEQGFREARRLLGRAAEADPSFALAKAFQAMTHVAETAQGFAKPEFRAEGVRLAREALALERDDPSTLRCAGHALVYLARDFAAGGAAVERALFLNPNSAVIQGSSGWLSYYIGKPAEGVEHFQKAMRFSPVDPGLWFLLSGLAHCQLLLQRDDEALESASLALRGRQNLPPLLVKAVALVGLERLEEARATMDVIRAKVPDLTAARLGSFIVQQDPEYRARYVGRLIAAGLPE